jgi:peptidoglycan hydrolase-like protein with peptidoglycan-binding domain
MNMSRLRALASIATAIGLAMSALSVASNVEAAGPTHSLRDKIVSIARSQVGTAASPQGSNCNPYSPGGICEAWCADFAGWVWQHADSALPRFSYSGDYASWALKTGHLRSLESRAQPGDLLAWGSWSYSNHISVVVAVRSDGYIESVDGNFGDRVTLRSYYPPDLFLTGNGSIFAIVSPERVHGGGGPVPPPTPSPPYPGYMLEEGSTGTAVMEVQRALHIPADGIFGPQTYAAVIAFQRTAGIVVDGIVGPQTWGALFGGVRPPPPPSAHPYPGHPLAEGSTGPAVGEVQAALHVAVDGIFGPQTTDAVIAFQRKSDIQVDGIVGPQTWAALF